MTSNVYVGALGPDVNLSRVEDFTILTEVDVEAFEKHPESSPEELRQAIKGAAMMCKALERDFKFCADFGIYPKLLEDGGAEFKACLLSLKSEDEQKIELPPHQSMLLFGYFKAVGVDCDILLKLWDIKASVIAADDSGDRQVEIEVNNDPSGDIKDYTKAVLKFKFDYDKCDVNYVGSFDIESGKFKGGNEDDEEGIQE